jgi:hypothetical protein
VLDAEAILDGMTQARLRAEQQARMAR